MPTKQELEFQKAFRNFLKHYKTVTGKTQTHMAADCDVSQQTMSRLINHPKTTRKWSTIYRVLLALQPEAINVGALTLGPRVVSTRRGRTAERKAA